jgi:hypothetical protein
MQQPTTLLRFDIVPEVRFLGRSQRTLPDNQGERPRPNWLIHFRGSIFTKANNSLFYFALLRPILALPRTTLLCLALPSLLCLVLLNTSGDNTLCLCDTATQFNLQDNDQTRLHFARRTPLGQEVRGIQPCQSEPNLPRVRYSPPSPVRVGGTVLIKIECFHQINLLSIVSTLRCVHVCNLLLRYLPEIDAPTLLNLLLCLNVCELLSAGYSHLLFFLNLPLLVSALQCAHVLSETKGNLVNVCSWKPTDQNPGKLACPGSFLCPDLAKSPDNNSCAHVYLMNVCTRTPTDQNPGKLACPGSFLC